MKSYRVCSTALGLVFGLIFSHSISAEEGAKALFFKRNESYNVQKPGADSQSVFKSKADIGKAGESPKQFKPLGAVDATQTPSKLEPKVEKSPVALADKPLAADSNAKPIRTKAKPVQPSNAGLQAWVNQVVADGQVVRVSPIKHVFSAGDKIRLAFRTNTAGYLYVVNVGTSGKANVLFPRKGGTNLVPAFMDLELGGNLVFDSRPGTEQIAVILSKTPRNVVEISTGQGLAQINLTEPSSQLVILDKQTKPSTSLDLAESRKREEAGSSDSDNAQLAIADLTGAKDLMFEDDGEVVTVVMAKPATHANTISNASKRPEFDSKPLVVSLKLKHQ